MKAAKVETDYLIFFLDNSGERSRGSVHQITKAQIVFETYNPDLMIRLSDMLIEFTVVKGEKVIYEGGAVVTNLVNTGMLRVVSATLIDPWKDLVGVETDEELKQETENFVKDWESSNNIRPGYQLIVNKIRSFFAELNRWLNRAEVANDIDQIESNLKEKFVSIIEESLIEKNAELFRVFEEEAQKIPHKLINNHKAHAQRALHPLMLCSPFVYRTFAKPFGYAGDYLMVNMILSDPLKGKDTYTKIVNSLTLRAPGAEAHRNRIKILTKKLVAMAAKSAAISGKLIKVRNIACGPAQEVVNFVRQSEHAENISFCLIDADANALKQAKDEIKKACFETGKIVNVEYIHKDVKVIVREAARHEDGSDYNQYDLVYCAGLFDYFNDKSCKRFLKIFYSWIVPGGEVLATNVHEKNTIRGFMEHLMEWHLVYREHEQFDDLSPEKSEHRVYEDETGFNIFLELKKPHG